MIKFFLKIIYLSIGLLFLLMLLATLGGNYDFAYPAFDAPLIQGNSLFANRLYGNDLICLDMPTRSIRWRTRLSGPIIKIWGGNTNEIIVVHGENISSVNRRNGQILFTKHVGKHLYGVNEIFGVNEEEGFYYQIKTNDVICSSYITDAEFWRYRVDLSGCYMTPSLCEKSVFLSIHPSTTSLKRNAPYEERFVAKGLNKLVCISAADGGQIWEEMLPLSKAGYSSSVHLSSGSQYNLCLTENAIRFIEKSSGKVVKRWESREEDIDGADFWKQGYLVVCFGGIGSTARIIRVLNIKDFSVYSEFKINAREVSSVKVIGDTLMLESLYRNIGVDLSAEKKIWETFQWHYNVKDGEIFFGQYDKKYEIPVRILGKCDPATGSRVILFSEMVGIFSMNYRIWPLSFVIIIFVLGITGIVFLWFFLHKLTRWRGQDL